MNIEKHLAVINACRFCFMCRHLSAVGNVTCREADTPRSRALILDRVRMNAAELKNPDFIRTVYEAELSGSCRTHCVSHYDEIGLLLAARLDMVEAGVAPQSVTELAAALQQTAFKTEGKGEVLYYLDPYTEQKSPEVAHAFLKLAGECKTLKGGDCGKALSVLGFADEAGAVFGKFAAAVKASGCKTLVTSCPATYHALKHEFKLERVTVLHSSEHLLSLKLQAKKGGGKPDQAYYLDSDYFRNYCVGFTASLELLRQSGYESVPFGTNPEESYACGEGAVVYDRLQPALAKKLCERVGEIAARQKALPIVVASPYTRFVLRQYQPKLTVLSLEEAVEAKL